MRRSPRRLPGFRRALCWLPLLTTAFLAGLTSARAETPAGLVARVDAAIRQVDAARDQGAPLPEPGLFFPESEEVSWGEGALRLENASLRAEWRGVPPEGNSRREALERLRHRLAAVRAEVHRPGAGAGDPPPAGWREKLAEVMSYSEFEKRLAEESLLSRAIRWLSGKLSFLLPQGARSGLDRAVGWIVYILAGATLLFILFVLVRTALPLFLRDRQSAGTPALSTTREPETPEALLALAEARIRAGNLRGAVQATFRWMLLTLHQANRLQYDPALTNREHLSRLKADPGVRAAFEELSLRFDHIWYGLRPVSPEEWTAFRASCQDLARGRA